MRFWQLVAIVPLAALSLAGAVHAQDGAEDAAGRSRDVDPALCVGEPRSFDDLSAILGLAAEGIPQPPLTAITPPLGEFADPDTVTAVSDAARQILACFNAGDIPRAAGLMTEAGVQRVYWGLGQDEENRALSRERLPAPPERRADEFLIRLIAVADVVELPEGRVAAFVVINEPLLAPGGPETLLFIFANQDGTWLLDDLIDFSVAPIAPAAEATPAV
jgi:hypothetical protein